MGARMLILHAVGSLFHAVLLLLPFVLSGNGGLLDRASWFFIVQMTAFGALEFVAQDGKKNFGKPRDIIACRVAALSGFAMLAIFWCALAEHIFQAGDPLEPVLYRWEFYSGAAASCLGMILRICAIVALGDRFQTDIELSSAGNIHNTGLYRYMAHPGEVGYLLIVTGGTIQLSAPIAFIAAVMFLVPISIWRMHREDTFLSSLLSSQQ